MSSPPAPAPAHTPTAAAAAPPSPSAPTDDTNTEPHLLSSLAHLQSLHLQLQHLRSTIPRLLSPLLTPGAHASPEEFYAAVRASAVGTGEEVERFRERWRGWREGVKGEEKVGEGDEEEGVEKEEEGVGIEEVEGVVGRWRVGKEGVEVETEAGGRGIQVHLPPPARIHFHITATSTPNLTTAFDVTCEEAAQVHKAVLRSVAARPRPRDLEALLDMLASYKDVKEKPCRTCGKLLDHRAMFPVVRRRKSTKNEDGTWKSNWEALHEDCS